MNRRTAPVVVVAALAATAPAVAAESAPVAATERVQVTATRLPGDVLDVPVSITVVSGEELAARVTGPPPTRRGRRTGSVVTDRR